MRLQGLVWTPPELSASVTEVWDASQGVPGMLIANLLHLPETAAPLSVELKPKCGCLPTAESIHPDNRRKRRISRYQLHQQLKVQQVCSTLFVSV
jgi:hypothetical protein